MALFAQVHLEVGAVKYPPGATVPEDLPGLGSLIEHEAVGPSKPTQHVVIDTDGRVVGGDGPSVERFDGDFTHEQIADPKVDTPSLGIHRSETDHREQEPHIYDEGQASD